jgi:intein/homing endonuclease
MTNEIWVGGFPSLLGGADTECLHNIDLWRKHGVDVHLVPMFMQDSSVAAYCKRIGCFIHDFHPAIFRDKLVVSYCNGEFLNALPSIMEYGKPASVGWFNCVPADAIISGKEMKRANEIVVGDLVYGHDGRLHKVLNTMSRNEDKITKIKVVGLPPIRLTDNHKVLVHERIGSRLPEHPTYNVDPVWKRVNELQIGDYVLVPKLSSCSENELNKERSTVRNKANLNFSSETAWLFGIFVADGHAIKGHKVSICLSDINHVKRAIAAFADLGLTAILDQHDKFTNVVVYSASLADTFFNWFKSGSHNKQIPDFLFNKDWDHQSILDGLCDGDGCQIRNEFRYSTVSQKLMLQVFHLAVKCGYRPTVYEQKRGLGSYANAKKMYVVRWVKSAAKVWQTRWHNNNYCLPVTSIEIENYQGNVYDFEIEDSHSFICDGVSVHNCMTWTFPKELDAQENGWINFHGFVSSYQRKLLQPQLEKHGDIVALDGYRPYFNPNNELQQISFAYRQPQRWFASGRISRDDQNKFSQDMWSIFYKICAPIQKKTFILGFGRNAQQRCGPPPKGFDVQAWDAGTIPVKEIYTRLHCIIHKTGGSRESYCRIVPEAYAYGVPVITEDDYAFPDLIVNGVTGFRCKSSDEMSYRASELAFDEEKRKKMIYAAYDHLIGEIASSERCWQPWKDLLANL